MSFNETPPPKPKTSPMAIVASIALIIFIGLCAFLTFSLVSTTRSVERSVETVTQPLGKVFQELALRATPVILPDPITIVLEINDIARLETASLLAEKVITAETNTDVWFGLFEDKLVFVAYGEVIAGIDMQKMTREDVVVHSPTEVHVHLPAAEILVATLDNEQSRVEYRDTGLLAQVDPQLETQVRQEAEREILNTALERDILLLAQRNGETYMTNFLKGLGFETVIFTEETPAPAPPYVQDVPKGTVLEEQ